MASGLKSIAEARVGDTLTDADKPAPQAIAGLQGGAAAGLRRHLPDAWGRLPAPARGAREAAPQRRQLRLRAGVERGAGLRLPLRLPRPAAHGDRAGAARARVRPGAAGVGAERRVPRQADASVRRAGGRQPGQDAGRRRDRGHQRAVGGGAGHHADRLHRPDHGAGHRPTRPVRATWSTWTRSGSTCTSSCRWPS